MQLPHDKGSEEASIGCAAALVQGCLHKQQLEVGIKGCQLWQRWFSCDGERLNLTFEHCQDT